MYFRQSRRIAWQLSGRHHSFCLGIVSVVDEVRSRKGNHLLREILRLEKINIPGLHIKQPPEELGEIRIKGRHRLTKPVGRRSGLGRARRGCGCRGLEGVVCTIILGRSGSSSGSDSRLSSGSGDSGGSGIGESTSGALVDDYVCRPHRFIFVHHLFVVVQIYPYFSENLGRVLIFCS